MTMIAKFDGRCKRCGCTIAAGTVIEWAKGFGATHATVQACDVARAAKQATASTSMAAPVAIEFSAVVAFLAMARERGLKAPKVRFLHGAAEVRLSLAKDTGANPGAVYVKLADEYVGLIAADGTVRGSRDAGDRSLTKNTALVASLRTIADNPAAAAKAYAALMGRCSFCSLQLTDAGSVEAGYGPVCAKKYGLPHTALGTPALQTVAA